VAGGLSVGGLGLGDNDALLVDGLEERPDDGTIGDLSTSESGKLEPEDEKGLEGEVPREVVKKNSEGQGFEEVEETEDDPVSQPLNVILGAR